MIAGILVVAAVFFSGCTGIQGTGQATRSYSVNSSGVLSLTVPPVTVTENVLDSSSNITVSRLVFHTPDGEVYGLMAAPVQPKAAFVHAPGAGVKKEGHKDRAVAYASQGYAYLVLDIRGNGGETPGYPMDIEKDYTLFQRGGMPEYYDIVGDMINARQYLSSKYSVPVYSSGESNGGRYAALAAAIDPQSAGYIGISTSGFGRAGDNPNYTVDARKFLLSIDPDLYVSMITPRPVYIFHATADPIIPFADGKELFDRASEPKKFFPFNGTHGVNGEVDQIIFREYAQIYG
ncbi:MAG TPA: alpha/beta hydrolase [Methanoregulaceae archaeon]|nr:alpha/beta hydrolase [Methanoregulaceae archaeon]